MQRFILLLHFLLIALVSQAQNSNCTHTLKVKVIDKNSLQALPGSIVNIDGSILQCDDNGMVIFSGLCETSYKVSAGLISYQTLTKEVNLKKNNILRIELIPQENNLSNVNIVSERLSEQTSMSKIELKGHDLEKTRGLSLSDALKEIPGVTTLQTGPTISKPVIQGMHSSRILIINNGIRQEGQQWGSEHAPEIDAFIANKLTVIKGAGSIKYGSDAIGGVILVEPNPLKDSAGIEGEVNLVGISNGRQGVASGILEGRFSKIPLQWRVQGTLKKAGDISTPNYNLSNTGFDERNFSWALGYDFGKLKTELFYSQFNTDIGVFKGAHIGNLTDLERAFQADKPFYTDPFSYKIDRPKQHVEHELFKLKSDYWIDEKTKLVLVLARQYNLRDEYDKDKPLNDSLAALNRPELHYEITTYSGDASVQRSVTDRITSSLGVNYMSQQNTYSGRPFIPNYENISYAVYSVHQYKHNRLMAEVGVRYDHRWMKIYQRNNGQIYSPERTFSNLSFNAGIDYHINDHFAYHLNIGTAFRAPSVNELYANGLHHGEGKYIYSDETINPEYAKALIMGFEIFDFKRITGHVDLYFKQIDGYIYLKPVFPATLSIRGAFPSFRHEQDDAYFMGVDAKLSYMFSSKIRSLHKINIVRAYNMSTKQYLPFIPSDRFENGIKYSFKDYKLFEQSNISLSVLNVLKQTRLEPNSDYKDSPSAYMILNADASTRVHISKQHFELGMSINNLLNTTYREYMNAFRYFTDEPGTSVVFRIKYHF